MIRARLLGRAVTQKPTCSAHACGERSAGWSPERGLGRSPVCAEEITPARLKLIFDVNTRMAWSAGRWEHIQAAKDSHPDLCDVTRADERVRESHRVWHNVTLPVDDAGWVDHYPPNGQRWPGRSATAWAGWGSSPRAIWRT